MTIFAGADPGTANYGYTVLKAGLSRSGLFRAKPLVVGMWPHTVTNLTNKPVKPPKSKRRKRDPHAMIPAFQEQMVAFVEGWEQVFEEFRPRALAVERYQARGMMGKTIENVNMMNGVLWGVCDNYDADYECITAATWKNQVNRFATLEEFYLLGLTPHSVDSYFIAVYAALKYHDRKWDTVDWAYCARQLRQFGRARSGK